MKYKIEYENPGGVLPNAVANELEVMLDGMFKADGNKQFMKLEKEHLEKYLIEWFTNHLKIKK